MSASKAQAVEAALKDAPKRWLVTGAAGFIGSHLVEHLLRLGQKVVGLDNFATGHRRNIDEITAAVGTSGTSGFEFIQGDIRDAAVCQRACKGLDIVLHEAALGSVPRSIDDPATTHSVNVDGFLNMLIASRDQGVPRFVYASSSSVYGDHPALPKLEGVEGSPLSPYAATKRIGEIYASVFQRVYGVETVGLRYFNVFGARQDADGPYAAVIPRWVAALVRGEACRVFGDGETSRDFCYVANVVQANILAATCPSSSTAAVYNIAHGSRTTLNELFEYLRERVARINPKVAKVDKIHEGFRPGDVRHSHADIGLATKVLAYMPTHGVSEGLDAAIDWYVERCS